MHIHDLLGSLNGLLNKQVEISGPVGYWYRSQSYFEDEAACNDRLPGRIAIAPDDQATTGCFIEWFVPGPPTVGPFPAKYKAAAACGLLRASDDDRFVAELVDLEWGEVFHYPLFIAESLVHPAHSERFSFRNQHPRLSLGMSLPELLKRPSDYAGQVITLHGQTFILRRPGSSSSVLFANSVDDLIDPAKTIVLDQEGLFDIANSQPLSLWTPSEFKATKAIVRGRFDMTTAGDRGGVLSGLNEICMSTSKKERPEEYMCYQFNPEKGSLLIN